MKQFTTAVVAAIVTLGASAEGYQVNTFSAKQEGMGHVGVAMKLGAESQIFNPGALAFMNKTMEISGAMSGIKATANAYLPELNDFLLNENDDIVFYLIFLPKDLLLIFSFCFCPFLDLEKEAKFRTLIG